MIKGWERAEWELGEILKLLSSSPNTNSKNVLGLSHLPNKPKKLPGGQQDQENEVVHHYQGEGYQQPKSFIGTKIPYSC